MSRQSTTDNRQPKLKVCGLTKINQIQELITMKVDFLGFIFYEKSPRYVLKHLNLKEIAEIPHQAKVGIFVNETVENIIEISNEAGLNFIQLHGDENTEFISRLRQRLSESIQIIKVIRIGNQTVAELQTTINNQPTTINYLIFDTDSKAFGGTGKTFDWTVLNQIEIPKPFFLSGGISIENVSEIENLNQKPFALDINSKFETEPGNKNIALISEFKDRINSL